MWKRCAGRGRAPGPDRRLDDGVNGGYKRTDAVLKLTMHPLTQIRQNLRTIRECYDVARIGIFGSVVRNEETPASDIDILVEF